MTQQDYIKELEKSVDILQKQRDNAEARAKAYNEEITRLCKELGYYQGMMLRYGIPLPHDAELLQTKQETRQTAGKVIKMAVKVY